MGKIRILDCTLRDGGYVNSWKFGYKNIQIILEKLVKAKIDIVECGFLTNKVSYTADSSQFNDAEQIIKMLPQKRDNTKFVVMINFNEYTSNLIPYHTSESFDGIRIAFHKKDMKGALELCQEVKEKGYEVFIQPMVTSSYSDKEFLELISIVNKIQPFAFYIADSFGSMKTDDLLHLFYLADYNLLKKINMGFHSHNNLQLSYSHAQTLAKHVTSRTIFIDSSIMGMGRGAGNLNTELFSEYLNHFMDTQYEVAVLLQIIDEIISPIYQTKYWGYSLPYYLSATHNCHPNYATFLDNKNTLTCENIHEIFQMMIPDKKVVFDKQYIEDLYMDYQARNNFQTNYDKLSNELVGKDVLILAPGRTLSTEYKRVVNYIEKEHPIVIAINFVPENILVDYVFVSNFRRWENVSERKPERVILTSNLKETYANAYIVKYQDLLNENDWVRDNAGMMLISLLIKLHARSVSIAGLDGYNFDSHQNFINENMEFKKSEEVMQGMNEGMTEIISKFAKSIPLSFVTTPQNVSILK